METDIKEPDGPKTNAGRGADPWAWGACDTLADRGALGPHGTRADRGPRRVVLRATAGGKLEINHSGEKLGVGEKGMENETYVHVSSQNRSTVFLFALCS